MYNIDEISAEINERLKPLNPYKVILFGSYANGDADENSDIDLLVVLNKEEIPQNFKEKLENKVLVRNMILSLSKEVPIDLLVYSRKEYELINLSDNSFARNINKFGKILS